MYVNAEFIMYSKKNMDHTEYAFSPLGVFRKKLVRTFTNALPDIKRAVSRLTT